MNAQIKIEISTNRIFFERFEAPCGDPEDSEIRNAWESTIYETIEAAGFEAKTTIGVDLDPACSFGIAINDIFCAWSNPFTINCSLKEEITQIVESITGDCACNCENCDCEERAEEFVTAVLPSILRDARRVAEQALENATGSAQDLSDKFVKDSESVED